MRIAFLVICVITIFPLTGLAQGVGEASGYPYKKSNPWTTVAKTLSGEALVEHVVGKSYDDILKQAARDIANAPKSWANCISRIDQCADDEAREIAYRALSPIIERYKAHLENSARGRWRALPERFIKKYDEFYPEITLSRIRYAEGINTLHGAAITWGENIYFPRSVNIDNENDLKWMLHEIQHSVQYRIRGGYKRFLSEYIVKSIGKVLERGNFSVHDFLRPERDADRKAREVLSIVSKRSASNGWTVCNKSSDEVVSVAYSYYSKQKEDWETKGWRKIRINECSRLIAGTLSDVSNNDLFYYHATSKTGKWSGDHSLCVKTSKFTIYGNSCRDGAEVRQAVEVDTGGRDSYTTNLVD